MALRRAISRFEILVVALLGVALVWRFIYFLEMYASPYAFDFGIDGGVFQDIALQVVEGKWTNGETFYQAPVYPRFLGVIYLLFGVNPIIAKVFQIVLSVASCWLVFDISRRVFERSVAAIALALSSVYGAFLFYSGEFVAVTLFMFLCLLALDLLIWTSTRNRLVWWWVAGLAFGLAAITRGTILPFVAVVPIWIVASRWRADESSRGLFDAALFAVGVGLVVAPVTYHNYRADGDFVLIASNDGLNFYIGNNPDSDGTTTAVVGLRGDQRGGTEDQYRVGREDLGDPTASPGAVSRSWYRKGFRFIGESPGHAIRLTVHKAFLLINAYEFGNVRVVDFVGRHSWIFRNVTIRFWLIVPLAAAGLALGRGRRPQVVLLYAFAAFYSLVVIVFVVTARYRLPIVPILIIFSAVAINEWWLWLKQHGWTVGRRSSLRIAGSVVVAVLVAVAARPVESIRNNDAQAFFGEAEAYRGQGAYPEAAHWYALALVEYPQFCDAGFNLGRIHSEVFGDPQSTVAILEGLVGPCGEDIGLRRLLGKALCAIERCEEGVEHLSFVAERMPSSAEARADLDLAIRATEAKSR